MEVCDRRGAEGGVTAGNAVAGNEGRRRLGREGRGSIPLDTLRTIGRAASAFTGRGLVERSKLLMAREIATEVPRPEAGTGRVQ
jgi:hypothetical protein